MAEDSSGSQVFAGRYRFKSVDEDWDTGRTGFTHLAYDTKEDRTVVIKRTDVTSPQSRQHEHSLQNESQTLEKLKGLGVPELYETNQAVYGNQQFTYLVMEYIQGIRVENEISLLKPLERARILFELFRLLAKSHSRGITNGDIDLKHLFWFRKEKRLSVIDWGNASIALHPRKHQLAYDLARSAEIIYALVTKGVPVPVTGSLALPEKEKIIAELQPLPQQFYELCKWAPRSPSEEIQSPISSLDMFIATQQWISRLNPGEQYIDLELDSLAKARSEKPKSSLRKLALGGILALFLISAVTVSYLVFSNTGNPEDTPDNTASEIIQVTPSPLEVSTEDNPVTLSATSQVPTQTLLSTTPTSEIVPSGPREYTTITGFDQSVPLPESKCWTSASSDVNFAPRNDKQWQFQITKDYTSVEPIKLDFNNCLSGKQASAVSLNFWIQRIALNSKFGIYVEYSNGTVREYVMQTDATDNTVHLVVRESGLDDVGYTQISINPNLEGDPPRQYYQYSVKLFLELNNQGQDIIYFSKGSDLKPLTMATMDTNHTQMKLVDTRSSLNAIKSIGLIGYGSDIQVFVWPLAFYEDASN